jgi:RNA recognition motif-containing protein
MAKKLFVGNLPFAMNDGQLRDLFSQYGNVVSANIVIDRYAKRSKGFGFVEFENEEDAAKAMTALNGSEQMGRNIAVKEALPKPEKPNNQ